MTVPSLAKRPATSRRSLADVVTKPRGLPSRVIVHGVPAIGKSSLAAHAPKPVFIMSKLETGIETLKDAGLAPETVGMFPECQTWTSLLETVAVLYSEPHEYKTVVVDTINGCERMAYDHVCQRDYNNNMAAFAAYQAGYRVAIQDWRNFLSELDKCRERGLGIILLGHTKVKNFRNPEGADYDRYIPDLHEETWSVTHGWADIVLFANYQTHAEKERGQSKAKAHGGSDRMLYTQRCAAWDAKHRHGLPEIISMGDSGAEAWANFKAAMAEGRKEKA